MKSFFLIIFVCAITFSVKSQDTLVQTDGQKIIVKVQEITPDYVKYKKYNNLDGPMISLQKSKVYMIIYQNGTSEVLNQLVKADTTKNKSEVQYQTIDKDSKKNVTTVTYSKIEYKRSVVDDSIFSIIKLNPLLIFVGEIPVYYERRLADHIGLEGSIGITLTDYLNYAMDDAIDINNEKTKIGYSFSLGLHLYTSKFNKGMDELYFSPEIKIKNYYSELFHYGNQSITPAVQQSRKFLDFQLKLGYLSYWSDNVCVDYYCGIGLRNRNITSANIDYVGNTIDITMNKTQDLVPCISAGVKIGYGW
jgi:hypothetical protein